MKVIEAENIVFEHDEVKAFMENIDSKRTYNVINLVYYPYLFTEYEIKKKSIFQPFEGKVGCTVDGINKIGALADRFPTLQEKKISTEFVIESDIKKREGKKVATKYISDFISRRKKVLSMPKLVLTRLKLFYRPYWITESKVSSSQQFLLTVDAVTGKYHPL